MKSATFQLRDSYVRVGREIMSKQLAAMRAIEGVKKSDPATAIAAARACAEYLYAATRYGLSIRLNIDFWRDVFEHGWRPVVRECVRLSMSDFEEILAENARRGREAN